MYTVLLFYNYIKKKMEFEYLSLFVGGQPVTEIP